MTTDGPSTSEIIAWTAFATSIITQIGREVANVIKELRRDGRVVEKIDQNTALTEHTAERMIAVSAKADVIKESVDGTSHAQAAKIDAMQAQLDLMHKLLADKEETARAQAAATQPPKE